MTKKSTEDLEQLLRSAAALIGIPVAGGTKGRIFRHLKSGDLYVAVAVGLREETATPEVVYHPVDQPLIRWHRPLPSFVEKFAPVPPAEAGA